MCSAGMCSACSFLGALVCAWQLGFLPFPAEKCRSVTCKLPSRDFSGQSVRWRCAGFLEVLHLPPGADRTGRAEAGWDFPRSLQFQVQCRSFSQRSFVSRMLKPAEPLGPGPGLGDSLLPPLSLQRRGGPRETGGFQPPSPFLSIPELCFHGMAAN